MGPELPEGEVPEHDPDGGFIVGGGHAPPLMLVELEMDPDYLPAALHKDLQADSKRAAIFFSPCWLKWK
jgi:hypothetical protein